MKDVRLPGSDQTTSAIGFGCASLFGGWETRRSLRLVDLAFEHGYRHFDVAPAYGFGMAEEVLGKALQGRRDEVTLASKAGLDKPRHGLMLLAARRILRPLKRLPVGRDLGRGAYAAAMPKACFDIESVEGSLHRSLRALKTDRLDLFLLHELRCEQISDELLAALSRFRRDGKVLSLGTATSLEQTQLIRARFGSVFDVWQHSFELFAERPAFPPMTITHGSLHHAFARLQRVFAERQDVARMVSDSIDLDLHDARCLSLVLIGCCRAANKDGLTLLGSRQGHRISENAAVLHDAKWTDAGAKLNLLLSSPDGLTIRDMAGEACRE